MARLFSVLVANIWAGKVHMDHDLSISVLEDILKLQKGGGWPLYSIPCYHCLQCSTTPNTQNVKTKAMNMKALKTKALKRTMTTRTPRSSNSNGKSLIVHQHLFLIFAIYLIM